jgi:hypothetical protein
MAYLGVDPWRQQYFDPIPCPPGLDIPIDEASAWEVFPKFRHIHNKLWICASQEQPHGPHGTEPPSFPVFSKPIYNMRGMGTGSRVIRSRRDYESTLTPGHFWMPVLRGEHVSSDAAVLRGRVTWMRHTRGFPRGGGTFDRWHVEREDRPKLTTKLRAWLSRYFENFTGIVNIETLGGTIIECHLRMAEQWLDLNGKNWLQSVVDLYRFKRWDFDDTERHDGHSIVLFKPHARRWQVDQDAVAIARRRPGVASIQVTFDPRKRPISHAMPPGGFRLAIINCWDLALGRRVRRELASAFTPD